MKNNRARKINEITRSAPKTKPSKPSPEPGTKPGKPKPSPGPGKPSPIRRERPSTTPGPKLTKKSAEDVAKRYIELVYNE
ncbi:MAG: hypothetical protein ACOC1O_01440 [bacterium]